MNSTNNAKNVSAFMVHHVLNKTKKRKKKLPIIENKIALKLGKIIKSKRTNASKSMKKRAVLLKNQEQSLTNKNNKFGKRSPKPNSSPSDAGILNNSLQNTPSKTSTTESQNMSFEDCFVNKRLLQWILKPVDVTEFFKMYWEKKPLHISGKHSEFSLLLSTTVIDNVLRHNHISFTKNIDITFYSDGVKELLNQEGLARPHVVWDFYCNRCSIRMLNPQTFVPNIHKFTSELQDYFGCFVGCNAYLTPPHSQGFAPHYDDIEAFILQIEGKKLWKVYKPRSGDEVLPRYSSRDLVQNEIGEPLMEVLLEEGDVLYLPRGYIHQACTQDSNHSLHVTVSVYQCNAWIDLLEKAIPDALQKAWKNDVEYRKGLPLDYLKGNGFAKNNTYKETRTWMQNNIKSLIYKLVDYIDVDSTVDQLGVKFLYDALPPVLTEEEKTCSVFGSGLKMMPNGKIHGLEEFEFTEDIEIALLRRYVSRFVKHILEQKADGKSKVQYRLYYTTDNSLEYHGEQTSFLIVPKHLIKCVQFLFQSFPEFVSVKKLPPYEVVEDKINLVADLWERGIIRTKKPML